MPQISPRVFLAESDTITFRIYVENIKKGIGTYQARVEELELDAAPAEPEPVPETPTAPIAVPDADSNPGLDFDDAVPADPLDEGPVEWTLVRVGPNDSWDITASRPITRLHKLQVIANGAPGTLSTIIEIRPKTDEDRQVEKEAAERAAQRRGD